MRETVGPLFKLKKQYRCGIIPASEIEEMQTYKYYIDLSNVYMISALNLRFRSPKLIWLYIKLLISLFKYNPDVVHYTWPQIRTASLLYLLRKKVIMTVHDPLPHSCYKNMVIEKYRKIGFKRADCLILLNKNMTKEFCERYNIDEKKIFYSKLGCFDYLDNYPVQTYRSSQKYILFFGKILSYKGLEFLMPAMVEVHKKHPDWMLIIAGGGKFYFDISDYEKLDYIEIRNHFIDMSELVSLLKGCEFAIAPYKDATQSGLLLNAFSLNKPMVVTNVGNFPDMVSEGENGYIVPPCEIAPLVQAINSMIENPNIREEMSKNINNQWRSNQNWKKIVDGLLEIYKS